MRIPTRGAGVAVAILLSLALTAPAEADHGRSGGHGDHGRGGGQGPAQIDLPHGWAPEGITTDGKLLYGGSLADGRLFVAHPRSGDVDLLAPGAPGRVAVGLDYDRRRDLLWVAGGGTQQVRAQDADTGAVVATYAFPSADATPRFLNDVVVTRHAVFVTDSAHAELAVIPLGGAHGHHRGRQHHGGLPAPGATTVLPVTGDFVLRPGFNLNGIVRSGHALVSVQTNTGQLFRIRPRTGEATEIDLGGADLTGGDGLEAGHGRLYVVRNSTNSVAVVHLRHDRTAGEVEDELTSPPTATTDGFDTPTGAALVRQFLYVVNARFGTTPTPATPYWITRVDAH
jgi:sugar lactone lactonase YvrE